MTRAAAQPQQWAAPPLDGASTAALFALFSGVLGELRRRGILRSNNSPAADYAEWLVWKALGADGLAAKSVKGHDLVDEKYGRVQVKSRLISSPSKRGQHQAGVFRSDAFDHAALVLFDERTYEVMSAVLLPLCAVQERWAWRRYVRGWRLHMNPPTMLHPLATDITEQLRQTAAELS